MPVQCDLAEAEKSATTSDSHTSSLPTPIFFIFSSFYVILKSIVLTILLCVFFNDILELVPVSNTVTCGI